MDVTVVIPTMAGREAMLAKLVSTIPSKYEIIVVDDMDILLAAKRNKGAKQAKGEYLFFVDDDNYLAPGAIENALALAVKQGIGVVGFVACYDDKKDTVADGGSKRNYLTGFTYGINTNARICCIGDEPYEVDEVANAFMIHSELFFELYGFDEINFPIDLDEADMCRRIKDLGYKIMMHPLAAVYHHSQTYSAMPDFRRPTNAYYMGRNKILYQRKHLTKIQFLIYMSFFFWLTPLVYISSLIYRRKPIMAFHFIKGILHGLVKRKV